MLLCIFLVCYILTMAAAYVLGRLFDGDPAKALRISAVLQDLLTFIIPAVATALMVTRRPAELLCMLRPPKLAVIFAVTAILFISIPIQENIIYWNYHIQLPESMATFEQAAQNGKRCVRHNERTPTNTSVLSLIVNVLIIGIMAGLSEELLFRGCFQRLLTTGGVNVHVAIWTVAFCFSALHFQFFGFVPRMLLGAYFGYLLVWTGNVWVPVTAHILNNVMFVVTAWQQARLHGPDAINNEPSQWPGSMWLSVSLRQLSAFTAFTRYRNQNGSSEASDEAKSFAPGAPAALSPKAAASAAAFAGSETGTAVSALSLASR